jgi:ADP-ribose pyrophosphatase YjhB (NUDIX family)
MPISPYLERLRRRVGHVLILVPSVTAAIRDERGRVLLARHAESGAWGTIGGAVEPNEAPADALVREVWEESRVLVEPQRVLGVYGGPEFEVVYGNRDRVSYLTTVFECRIARGEPHADGTETLELDWFAEEEIAALGLPAWARLVLHDAFRGEAGVRFRVPTWRPPA